MAAEEFIFGIHAVTALLQQAPQRIVRVYLQQGRADQRLQQIMELLAKHHVESEQKPRHELDAMVVDEQHQGVVARCIVQKSYHEADIDVLLDEITTPPFLLILDGVQDPHNLGACLRSANAAGVHMVIAPRDRSVGLTPAVRKVACGAAEITPFIQVTNLARTLQMLKDRGIWLYGTDSAAQSSLFQTNLNGAVGLVLGAEGTGLRRLTAELCDGLMSIPMIGAVESLNVSVATGICLYEVLRQRMK